MYGLIVATASHTQRHAYVLEPRLLESRVPEDAPYAIRIRECERTGRAGRGRRRELDVLRRGGERHKEPWIRRQRLPADERDASPGTERAPEVRERRGR